MVDSAGFGVQVLLSSLARPAPHLCHSCLPSPSTAYRVRKDFCQENFLSIATLEMIAELRKQFRQQLVEIGFASRFRPEDEQRPVDVNLVKCVLCSGLYPNIGKLLRPTKPGEPACFETKDKAKLFVHPVRFTVP